MFLLDTCSLLWLSLDQTQLSRNAFSAIEGEKAGLFKNNKDLFGNDLFVSAISAFEIAINFHKGSLVLPLVPRQWFKRVVELHGLTVLPVDYGIYINSVELPKIHLDPADRIIIATALEYNLKIITPDKHIRQYEVVKTIW